MHFLSRNLSGSTLHEDESDRQEWLARGDTVNEWGEDVIPACRFGIDSFEAITDKLVSLTKVAVLIVPFRIE